MSLLHRLGQLVGHPTAGLFFIPIGWSLLFSPLYWQCGAPNFNLSSTISHCDATWAIMLLVFVLPPLLHLALVGQTIWIKTTVETTINVPLVVCSKFIRDARNLAHYEQKVNGCSLIPDGFHIWGSWFGLPFAKDFDMTLTSDGGFHSVVRLGTTGKMLPAMMKLLGSGGFRTLPDVSKQPLQVAIGWRDTSDDSSTQTATVEVPPTKLIHYESYGWPVAFPFLCLIAPAWRRWHRRGMEIEMDLIKSQVEHVFRELQKKSAVGVEMLHQQSVHAADYPPTSSSGWGDWKYGCDDFIKESLAEAFCRPYQVHHPAVLKRLESEGRDLVDPENENLAKRRRRR